MELHFEVWNFYRASECNACRSRSCFTSLSVQSRYCISYRQKLL